MRLTILGTPIDFPTTSQSPIWSDAIIQFAELVEQALSGLITAGDIAKSSFALDGTHNPGTSVNITGLSFDPGTIRAIFIRYSVYRNTSATTVTECGTITAVYNGTLGSGLKWENSVQKVGDASITFAITDAGQVQFSTTTLSGTGHTGKIAFVAQTLAI